MATDTFFIQLAMQVKSHRKLAGLSQLQLAEYAGVGKTVVFDIEHAKPTVQLNTIIRVINVLNISLHFDSPIIRERGDNNAAS